MRGLGNWWFRPSCCLLYGFSSFFRASSSWKLYSLSLRFFEQGIRNGYQVEHPDRWLKDVNVWEVRKDEESVEIPFMAILIFLVRMDVWLLNIEMQSM